MRTELHSTAESLLYGDIGQRPCLIEEIGTLGPMVANEKIAADFIRVVLFSGWAHDCHGLLWWCAFDLGHLKQAPYDWDAYERELGLFHADGTPKPVLSELGKFRKLIEQLPVAQLPRRQTDAICILSEGQDQWAAGYGSFILGKQAGLELEFRYADQVLPDAVLYLLPCISGGRIINRRRWHELLQRVHAGATLYVSHDNGMLSPFTEPFGFDVLGRSQRTGETRVVMDGLSDKPSLTTRGQFRLQIAPTRAEVLGREDYSGNPVFTRATYGKGVVYFLSFPMEKELVIAPGSFHLPSAQPCWQIYKAIAQATLSRRVARKDHPQIGLTEHPISDQQRAVVLINYAPEAVTTSLVLADHWSLVSAWHGTMPEKGVDGWSCEIGANDGIILLASRARGDL
jgi:hypothetical protein